MTDRAGPERQKAAGAAEATAIQIIVTCRCEPERFTFIAMIESAMVISAAALNDIPELEKLVNEAYRGPVSKKGWTTEADLLTGVRTDEKGLAAMIEKPGAVILKSTDLSGIIRGCVYLEKQDEDLYLGLLTVSPQIQGRGIGKQIMAATAKHAVQVGCRRITMGVISVRTELIAWYERHGFRKTGIFKPLPVDERFITSKNPLVLMEMAREINRSS